MLHVVPSTEVNN